ncbi:MAG: TAXI family TRAP transporter solute-binding subunit [Pseudomonadota bacterium]
MVFRTSGVYSMLLSVFSRLAGGLPNGMLNGPGLALLALLFVLSGALQPVQGQASEQSFITIGTAGVTGVYYPSGSAACRLVNRQRADHGVRCSVEATLGSISNIEHIRSGDLDFGFAQSDWQHHAFLGTSVFEDEGPFADLRSVLALHAEVATIVVKATSEIQSFQDLRGSRIDIGSRGSGSEASWNTLVRSLGWSDADRQGFSNRSSSELAEALCNDEIDAYFQLIGHPAALIEETIGQCDIRLIGVDSKDVAAFVEDEPYYMAASIPAGLYDFGEPTGSFGVVATIVTSAAMPDDIVMALVAAVHESFDDFSALHPALGVLSRKDMVGEGVTAPLHPGARKYFEDQGLLPPASESRED